MKEEEKILIHHLGKCEAYEEMCVLLSKMSQKSMKRKLWYFRPSHTMIMKIWRMANDEWADLIKKDVLNHN